jgi:ribokinase
MQSDIILMDVITIGKVHQDITFRINANHPEEVDEVLFSTGGSAVNTVIGLARLGMKTGIIGCVGNDWEQIKPLFEKEGIDTSNIKKTAEKTGIVFIKLIGDKKEMYSFPGADLLLKPEYINGKYLTNAKVVHIAGAKAEICRKALESSKFVTIDPGYTFSQYKLSEVKDIIGKLKFFFPKDTELFRITGNNSLEKSIKMVIDCGLETLIVKCGNIITIATKNSRIDVPVVKGNIVDISGCGDTFASGFLYGHLNKMSNEEACKFGIVCAKLKSEKMGASSSPLLEAVKREFAKVF